MNYPALSLAITATGQKDGTLKVSEDVKPLRTVMQFADGRVGQLTASLVHHGEDQQLVFQGEKAAAVQVTFKSTSYRDFIGVFRFSSQTDKDSFRCSGSDFHFNFISLGSIVDPVCNSKSTAVGY